MAAAKSRCLSFSILCMLIALFICQIQARDIKSFSQMSRHEAFSQKPSNGDNKEESVSVKSAAPLPESTAPRGTTTTTTKHGYGLYGYEQMPDEFPPTTADPAKTTTPGDVATRTTGEEKYVDGADEQELFQNDNAEFKEFEMEAVNAGRYNPNDNHGYNNNNNGYTTTEYNNNIDESYNQYYRNERHGIRKQQGMSDTRYLANGKYFYDLESETNNNYNYNDGKSGYDHDSGAENYNYNNRVNGYRTTTTSTDYKKNHMMNDNYWMSDQKRQGMSDTRFLNNGIYYNYHDNKNNNHQNGGYMTNIHGNNNNDGFNSETQGRGASYSSSHDEEDQLNDEEDAGFGINNSKNYNKPPYEYDSVEEYEKEEEQRLAQKYGYHGP